MAPEVAQRQIHALGGQQRLTRLAVILSLAAFLAVLALPAGVHPDLQDLRLAAAACGQQDAPSLPPTCYALAPGGVWEELHPDGTRTRVAHPTFIGECRALGKNVYVVREPPAPSLSFRCP